jgi:hypothetical protein
MRISPELLMKKPSSLRFAGKDGSGSRVFSMRRNIVV